MPKARLTNPEGSHLNEKNFRRFERIIERFLTVYPEPFTFKPTEISVATAVVRLREAVNFALNRDVVTILDIPALKVAWLNVQVTPKRDSVVIGNREAQEVAALALDEKARSASPLLSISDPSIPVLEALSILFLHQALTSPVLLSGIVPAYTPPAGIILEKNSDDTYTML